MRSAEPASIDPTGADRPLERQNMTVSTGAARSAASTPSATAALNSRAPSQWTGRPWRRAAAATASTCGRRPRHAPGRHVGVLDGHQAERREVVARALGGGVDGRRLEDAVPVVEGADLDAGVHRPRRPASYWRMWARAGQSTSVPGRARRRRAIWLPIVPDGT